MWNATGYIYKCEIVAIFRRNTTLPYQFYNSVISAHNRILGQVTHVCSYTINDYKKNLEVYTNFAKVYEEQTDRISYAIHVKIHYILKGFSLRKRKFFTSNF